MMQLETDRLILRNYRESDIGDLKAYFANEEVAKYEDFYPMTEDEIINLAAEWRSMDNRLVAELKSERRVIGSIGYWIDDDADYSIDFDFNPVYAKKGYATEAGQELVRYLFESVGIEKLYGDCDVRNENSWKLLERLGFQRIGQIDNESYKDDKDGNPILISIYLYLKRKAL